MAEENQSERRETEINIWAGQSISRVPGFIKEGDENSYEPRLVSIGPYHNGKDHLKPMEQHKHRAQDHFIIRSSVPIEDYKTALLDVEGEVRQSYEQLDEKWSSSETFLGLMMLDGFFVLEFLGIVSGTLSDYHQNDPVFSYYGCLINYNYLMRDMLLMDNQLPYLVLEKLLFVAHRQEMEEDISSANIPVLLARRMMVDPTVGRGRHMLDMFMKGLLRGAPGSDVGLSIEPHSATQLQKAGIQFQRINNYNYINFNKNNATLYLPPINISPSTNSTFKNLKAFELRGTTERDFNSYIWLMRTLIKSNKDVAALQSAEIIVNFSESDEAAVVKLFKDLAKDAVIDRKCKSSKAGEEVNKYYRNYMGQLKNELKIGIKERIEKWTSSLLDNYFTNPWAIISVIGATALLVLSAIQTIYTVLSYHCKQK